MKKLLFFCLLLLVTKGHAQNINPSTQIKWPNSCSTAGTAYSPSGNQCVSLGSLSTGVVLYPAQCQGGNAPSWCSGSTADAFIRAACGDLPSSGGTVNLAGLTGTIAASVTCSTPTKQVILIQDPTSTLTVTESDGGVVFPIDGASMFLGPGAGQSANNSGIKLASGANVAAIVGTAHTDGSEEAFTANGLTLFGNPGATVGLGLILTENNFANTTIDNNNLFGCNSHCIKVINGNDIRLENDWANVTDGFSGFVGTALDIQGVGGTGCVGGPVIVRGGQYEHSLGGGPEISVEGPGSGGFLCNISIRDVGVERSSVGTASTIGIKIQDSKSCEVQNILTTGAQGGSDLINISQSANGLTQSVILTNVDNIFASYGNTVNDTTPQGSVLGAFVTPIVTSYFSNPGYVQPPVLPGTTIQSLGADFFGGLGNFSTGSGTLPTGFGMTGCLSAQGLTCTYTRTNATAPPGFTFSQKIAITANVGGNSGFDGLQYNTGFTFVAGQPYVASFYAMGDGSFTGIPTFLLWNSTTGVVACQTSASAVFPASWTLYSFICTPTTSGTLNLSIAALTPIGATGAFWFADFVFSPVQPLTQGTFVGAVSPYGVGSSVNGVSIATGAGAPTSTCGTAPTASGSLWLRTDGGPTTTLYVCNGTTWTAK